MTKKKIRHDSITITINDKQFVGERTIEGTSKLFQTIHYHANSKFDGHPYRPHESANMDSIAKVILGELVRESGDLS
jgi:hypothetical protein